MHLTVWHSGANYSLKPEINSAVPAVQKFILKKWIEKNCRNEPIYMD